MAGCLEGLNVLDLTRVLAGPYCTMLLGDLGANVIKIENVEKGDDTRAFDPLVNGVSAYFASINRNKKSLTLNLKSDEGKKIFFELVKRSDVVVENFRPGVMKRLGLDYEVLKEINPKIIFASCSGFGQTGPWSEKPAYDIVVQALSGIMSITGTPEVSPIRVGTSIGDIAAGMCTAIGILSAIYYRNITGEGQSIDVSMLDSQIAILENAISRYYATGECPGPLGNRHPSIAPFDTFKAKDGYVIIAAANDRLWAKLCKVINREDLINDSRFITNVLRVNNQKVLKEILSEITKEKTVAQWIEVLESNGIPCSEVNTVAKAAEHEQVRFREMIVEVQHPVAGRIKMAGIPIKFSKKPGQIRMSAPLLGEHNNEILQALGYDSEQIKELRNKQII